MRTVPPFSAGLARTDLDLASQDGRPQRADEHMTARAAAVYFNYIASKVQMAVHEYAQHHHAEYAATWQSELLGPHGLTVVKLARIGELATSFIRWRLVYVEEEVRREGGNKRRLDELMVRAPL